MWEGVLCFTILSNVGIKSVSVKLSETQLSKTNIMLSVWILVIKYIGLYISLCWECRDFFINVVSGHIYGRHTTQLSLGFVSFPLASTDFSPPNWPIPCWQLLLTLAKLNTTFTMVGPQAHITTVYNINGLNIKILA